MTPSDSKPEREDTSETVIRARTGWHLPPASETWAYRDLLISFVRRDMALRYKQTALGPAWILLQPLLAAAVFSFVFTRVTSVRTGSDIPYFWFALDGMCLWTAVNQIMTRGTTVFVVNADLVGKIYFPRLLLPLSTACTAILDALPVLLPVTAYALIAREAGWRALLVLPVFIAGSAVALGLALLLGSFVVRYRDIQYAIPVLLQAALFVSPVLYSLAAVPEAARRLVVANPFAPFLELLRWSLGAGPPPSAGLCVYGITAGTVVCLSGLLVFGRSERSFADVI